VGYDEATGKDLMFIDPKYYRPTEVDVLWGDASKAAQVLGWRPRTSFQQLIAEMVQQDTQIAYKVV
jgi:GDPmannose 4,6-dehydratase